MITKTILSICIFLSILCVPAKSNLIYVDDDANGVNDGTSWENAYNYLQDALASVQTAPKPCEIYVAQGTYYPDRGAGQTRGDREASFKLMKNVILLGGFAGVKSPDPNERNVKLYKTILSGDLNCDDAEISNLLLLLYEPSRQDNSFHVVESYYPDEITAFEGFTITAGNANSDSHNIWAGGGGMIKSIFSLTNCTFIRNSAYYGGALVITNGKPSLTNCNFIENVAVNNGGAIYNEGNPIITNCTFTGNMAGIQGGALYDRASSDMTLTDCTFNSNMAVSKGGGMYNFYGKPSLTNCTFACNSAYEGGAIYNDCYTYFISEEPVNIYDNPVFTDCTFFENFAESGGGIYNNKCNPTLTKCTFVWNIAGSQGGGIYNYYSRLLLESCLFAFNVAGNDGGAINNSYYCSSTITNCIFSNNTAESLGGGLYNNSSSTITNCIFKGNYAYSGGGGITNYYNSKSTITGCTFSENTTDFQGAGIYNTSTSTITNSKFSENVAEFSGGGIYNTKKMIITNCIFSRNTAARNKGGGIYTGSNASLSNCTFIENVSRYGNAIYCLPSGLPGGTGSISILELTNSILWDDNEQIYIDNDSIINISYCDIKGGMANVNDPNGTINWGEGNINIDPCFVDPGYWDINDSPNDSNDDFWVDGDYHLKSEAGRWDPNSENWIQDDVTSPCIDAGDPNSPVYYEIFPNGGRINMGAYGGTEQASMSLDDTIVLEQASLPNPPDNSVDVLLDVIPGWNSDLDTIKYEVYFGKTALPQFIQKQYEMAYEPGPLEPNTQYYWRVDSIDSFQNRTIGNTWTFRTGFFPANIFYLSPSNGAIDLDVKTVLSWYHGLNSITYNIYFGTDFNDVNNATITNSLNVLVAENLETNSYYPGTLEFDQMYFWRIDETDNDGIVTKGDVWSFITMSKPRR